MQIRPNESLGLAYLIGDTTDNNLYYVQSVIRDTRKNTILSTINLTRDAVNSRRFYATTQAPTDLSNLGTYIDITTTVYTDSIYATKSPVYPESINTYLVQERWSFAFGGNGGGSDIDYKKLKKMLDASVKAVLKGIKIPKTKLPDIEAMIEERTVKLIDLIGALPSVAHIEDIKKSHEGIQKTISSMPTLKNITSIVNLIGSLAKSHGVNSKSQDASIEMLVAKIDDVKKETLENRLTYSEATRGFLDSIDGVKKVILNQKKAINKDKLKKLHEGLVDAMGSVDFDAPEEKKQKPVAWDEIAKRL